MECPFFVTGEMNAAICGIAPHGAEQHKLSVAVIPAQGLAREFNDS